MNNITANKSNSSRAFRGVTHDIGAIANHSHYDTHHQEGHDGATILFIFSACLMGALLRSLLKGTNIPYTVIILVMGCAMGILSALVAEVSQYTLISEIDPHLMLHIFLPILVFDSAYSLETHTLIKSFPQCVTLAVPVFILNGLLSGTLVRTIFPYKWSWSLSLCFGALISATDPVAVVTLLKDLGTDKKLAILIEGESLLNDASAMVFFTAFLQMARGEYEDVDGTGGVVTIFLIRVFFGGLALGYLVGKICSTWLSRVFNDAIVETIITIAFPYITYYVAEAILGVSGVLSVVVLGAVLSSEKTSISPEVEKFLSRQWNLLAFGSNTLIFGLVGLVIAEKIIKEVSDAYDYSISDWFYILVLYVGIMVIRGVVLLVVSPVLSRLGYGFDWSKGLVIWWGGLRGAVALALALLVAQDDFLDPHTVGNKFLLHAAGIVVLTLAINGCTMPLLLSQLGLTQITVSKMSAMSSAIKIIKDTQTRTIEKLKSDRFLADSHWDVVLKMSDVPNPYAHRATKLRRSMKIQPLAQGDTEDTASIRNELTLLQYKQYENEARIRYLKAQKISYWRQFERGMLGQSAVRRLMELTEIVADTPGRFINLDDVSATWKMKGIFKMLPKINIWILRIYKKLTRCQKSTHNSPLIKFITSRVKDVIISGLLLILLVSGVVDLVAIIHGHSNYLIFLIITCVVTGLLTVEIILKVPGYGIVSCVRNVWFILSCISLLCSIPEIYCLVKSGEFRTAGLDNKAFNYQIASAIIRIIRSIRIVESLVEMVLPALFLFIEKRIEIKLHYGYDVGRGFVVGEEECRELIDHIVEQTELRDKFKNHCDKNRLAVIKELALLQRINPGVAVSVKTRQAARTVLNDITETLHKITNDGLIDEGEADRIKENIDKQIKLLVSSPPSVPPMDAENMLTFVPWLQGVDNSIAKFMHRRAQLINFDHGDTILQAGESSKGIFIVVSGLIKIAGRGRSRSVAELSEIDNGTISMDRYADYRSAGAVLGELEPLLDTTVVATVTAETAAQLFFLSVTDLEMAFDMYPEVKNRLWKDTAVKVVLSLLNQHPEIQNLSKEAGRLFLERGFIPSLFSDTVYNIDDTVTYTFLVHGKVSSVVNNNKIFTAVCLLPPDVRSVRFNDPYETILFLIPVDSTIVQASDSITDHMKMNLKKYASIVYSKFYKYEGSGEGGRKRKLTLKDITEMLIVRNMLQRRGTQGSLGNVLPKEPLHKITEVKSEHSEISSERERRKTAIHSAGELRWRKSAPVIREIFSETDTDKRRALDQLAGLKDQDKLRLRKVDRKPFLLDQNKTTLKHFTLPALRNVGHKPQHVNDAANTQLPNENLQPVKSSDHVNRPIRTEQKSPASGMMHQNGAQLENNIEPARTQSLDSVTDNLKGGMKIDEQNEMSEDEDQHLELSTMGRELLSPVQLVSFPAIDPANIDRKQTYFVQEETEFQAMDRRHENSEAIESSPAENTWSVHVRSKTNQANDRTPEKTQAVDEEPEKIQAADVGLDKIQIVNGEPSNIQAGGSVAESAQADQQKSLFPDRSDLPILEIDSNPGAQYEDGSRSDTKHNQST